MDSASIQAKKGKLILVSHNFPFCLTVRQRCFYVSETVWALSVTWVTFRICWQPSASPTETPLSYRDYIWRFEAHDPMFFTRSTPSRTPVDAVKCDDPLAEVQRQLQDAREGIVSMENSKFWKLRQAWFLLKRGLGLGAKQ